RKIILICLMLLPFLTNAQWVQMNNGMGNREVWSLANIGNNIFAGTNSPGFTIYLSTNNGTSWSHTSLYNFTAYSLAIQGNYIFAGTYVGVYVTTDNGSNWYLHGFFDETVFSLA